MLALRSPTIYLLMASAVGVAFVGARLLQGRRALLTGETIAWRSAGAAATRTSPRPQLSRIRLQRS